MEEDESKKYPLARTWKIWEMWSQNKESSSKFTQNMQEIGEFNTIFTFWQHWNYFPHADPMNLFENPETKEKVIVEGINQSIEAIGVFENGIKPAWEDDINEKGCDIYIRKSTSDFYRLKEMWESLVLSVIGENMPHSEEIVGCRVVDKKQNYKFELWLKLDMHQDTSGKANEIKIAFAHLFGVPQNILSVSSHKRT
ncbi:hypothetical protein SteCoe_26059 [Stentor coeruleus]|uniref:Eukaryotic initiation factor 4E n=1 Tax=Stentor coeruleus TaxID=5963 RepID=A0A1R2BDR4_9CILI|nr:hypothetical protein SteCoe_26059 [Stentor coeruleus]